MRRAWRFVLIAVLLPGFTAFGQPGRKKVHQGNKLYAEKKYDAALSKYTDALLEDPGSNVARFNSANAAYKKNNWDKALEAYGKTLKTDDLRLQSQTHYNIGNAFYRKGKLDSSIQAYEQALKLNPGDQDAKYNLEFVRAKIKQNAQPRNQQQPQQQNQQQDNQDQQKQQDKQKQQEQENQENRQAQQRKTEMSKEQAEQLMNALNENRKKGKQEKVQAGGMGAVEKDW
jgi:tetratricopeptide (TPR) repeat protein